MVSRDRQIVCRHCSCLPTFQNQTFDSLDRRLRTPLRGPLRRLSQEMTSPRSVKMHLYVQIHWGLSQICNSLGVNAKHSSMWHREQRSTTVPYLRRMEYGILSNVGVLEAVCFPAFAGPI